MKNVQFSRFRPQLNRLHLKRIAPALIMACFAASLVTIPTASARLSDKRELSFYNLHTGESLRVVYWQNGRLVPQSLEKINHFLRDHRRNEAITMDTSLLHLLYALRARLRTDADFHVISGYRSPKTNAMLASIGRQVAKKSLHMHGRAIDIRLPGVPLGKLHEAAVGLKIGGVGLYAKNDFIHIDTGRVRYW